MSATTAIVPRDDTVATNRSEAVASSEHAALFVWGFWAFLTIQALIYVYRYGCKTPYLEDWYYVELLTGHQKLTWSWLWEQFPGSDHRLPVLKALFYLNYKLFGVDVRPILYLNLALFVSLAAGMICAARRVRGASSFTDALFPILLLTIGQAEVFLWGEAAVYVLSTFLVGSFLIIHMVWGPRLRAAPALAAGLCLVLLPLIYGGGVAYVPFLGLWMGYTGYQLLKSSDPGERRAGYVCLFFTIAAFVVVAAYMTGYKKSRIDIEQNLTSVRVGLVDVLKTSLKFLAMSLGPAARRPAYPVSGLIAVALIVVCAGCLTTALLRREPGRRTTAVGLSLYMMAYLLAALAVGVSRAGWGTNYLFYPRFAAVSMPLMFGVFFVWECFGPSRWIGLGRIVLFTLVACNLSLNNTIGGEPTWRTEETLRFERDVQDGISIPRLVSKYGGTTNHDHDKLEVWLAHLRDSRIGNYRYLPPDPKFKEVRLQLTPAAVHNVAWDGKTGRATGRRPFLVFDFEKPEFVCGLRIRYSSTNEQGFNPYFEVFMHKPERPAGVETERYMQGSLPTGKEVDVPIWIYKTIDRIRVHPDKRPCDFTISEIVLLLPESDSDRVPNDEDTPEAESGKHDDFADPIGYKN